MYRKQLLAALCLVAASASASTVSAQPVAARQEPRGQIERALSLAAGDNYVGVYTETLTRENQSKYGQTGEPRGVAVTRVADDSPAAKAGLQKGDVILAYDGERVTSTQKLSRLIGESAPEHTARLKVWRAGDERDVSVTLGRREFGRLGALKFENGEAFRLEGDQWKKQAEEWSRQGEEWKKNAEQWRKQAEEMRKQFQNMPRGENFNFGYVAGAGRRIGVTTTTLTEQLADYFGVADRAGLLVTSVVADGPAAKAGVRAGDVITEVEGEKVKTTGELTRAVSRKNEGEVTLTIVRERSRRTLRLTPEKRADSFAVPEGGLFAAPGAFITLPRVSMIAPRVVTPSVVVTPVPRLRPLVLPRVRAPRIAPVRTGATQLLEL
jgi:serine protease Do